MVMLPLINIIDPTFNIAIITVTNYTNAATSVRNATLASCIITAAAMVTKTTTSESLHY